MNTIPLALQNSTIAGRNPAPGTITPPSPWTGSTITAAIWSAPSSRFIVSMAAAAQLGPQSSYDAPVGQRYG